MELQGEQADKMNTQRLGSASLVQPLSGVYVGHCCFLGVIYVDHYDNFTSIKQRSFCYSHKSTCETMSKHTSFGTRST